MRYLLIHCDGRQVAGNETINLQKVAQAGQGDDVEAAFEFGNFFDRGGNRSLRMKFAQELFGNSADVVVGKAANAEFNRSAPFV